MVKLALSKSSSDPPQNTSQSLGRNAKPPRAQKIRHKSFMEGVASIVTLGAAGLHVSKKSTDLYNDYKHAPQHKKHAQHYFEQLAFNNEKLSQLPSSDKDCTKPSRLALSDSYKALPPTFSCDRKRDRLKWAFSGKSNFENETARIQRVESSLTLNEQMLSRDCLNEIKSQIEIVRDRNDDRGFGKQLRRQVIGNSQLCCTLAHTYKIVDNYKHRRIAQTSQWQLLARLIGLRLGFIITSSDRRKTLAIFARWSINLPWGPGRVLAAQMRVQEFVPSLPTLLLKPQNTIPSTSEIIRACKYDDILAVRKCLVTKQAHPNDRTPDGLTVFRVSKPAFAMSIL